MACRGRGVTPPHIRDVTCDCTSTARVEVCALKIHGRGFIMHDTDKSLNRLNRQEHRTREPKSDKGGSYNRRGWVL